jgi:hypothetical protein
LKREHVNRELKHYFRNNLSLLERPEESDSARRISTNSGKKSRVSQNCEAFH